MGQLVNCYTFPSAGTYTVTATATYSGTCSAIVEEEVVVNAPLVAAFTPSNDTTFCGPFCIDFTNQSTGIGVLNYQWYVDGIPGATTANPNICLAANSIVRLDVTNELGCTASHSMNVTITLPQLTLTDIPFGACVGEDICPEYILNNLPSEEDVDQWNWDFGDGFTSTTEAPCHSYATTGVFNICLIITTENGCTAMDCRPVTISPALNAEFGVTPQNQCAGNGVHFDADNTDGSNYSWSFSGDDCSFSINTGGDPFVNALPNCPGCFDVTLTINNDGCQASHTVTDAICFFGPVILFNAAQDCTLPFEVNFVTTYITSDTDSLMWDFDNDGIADLFGPASVSSNQNPTWDYSVTGEGTYQVCVTAYPANYPDTCSYTRCQTIYIDEPSANLSFTPTSGCPTLCVEFGTTETYNVEWEVAFGNGDTLVATALGCTPPTSEIDECTDWFVTFTDSPESSYHVVGAISRWFHISNVRELRR